MKIKLYLLLIIPSLFFNLLSAQEKTKSDSTNNYKDAIKLYIDCNYCDIDHFKKEIKLVNYVRDRKEADVHLIITSMRTGSGGKEYNLRFIGKRKYQHLNDTISFSLPPKSTSEEIRNAQITAIKRGLTPFILKTSLGEKIKISFAKDDEKKQEKIEDKWHSWVFEARISGYTNGEEVYTHLSTWGNISATKITPDIKIELNYNNSFNKSSYKFFNKEITSITKTNRAAALISKSIGEHWAFGGLSSIYSSTYSNIAGASSISPAFEYNVFKYSNATSKQLRFLYQIGYKYNKYIDSTIFDKITESYFYNMLTIKFKSVQEWGAIEGSVFGSTFLNDFSKNNIGAYMGGNVRLFKGLSFNLYGGYSQQRDQITLAKKASSTEDILLRKKEMASNYNFWMNFGLSYTFGSIYNNIVNPRFDN